MPQVAAALAGLRHYIDDVSAATDLPVNSRVGTALLWACAVDEVFWPEDGYEAAREEDADGVVLGGLRRARDVVAHRLVAVQQEGGLTYPLGPTLDYPPVWVTLTALGWARSHRSPKQDAAYVGELEGRRVTDGLERGYAWLRRWASRSR
jgi:hypothetical protein